MKMQLATFDRSVGRASDVLRALAHPGRLRIVCALMEGERTASELAHRTRMRAPALSQQAAILESRGLITRRREGQSVRYQLVAPEAKAMAGLLYRLYCKPSKAAAAQRGTRRGASR